MASDFNSIANVILCGHEYLNRANLWSCDNKSSFEQLHDLLWSITPTCTKSCKLNRGTLKKSLAIGRPDLFLWLSSAYVIQHSDGIDGGEHHKIEISELFQLPKRRCFLFHSLKSTLLHLKHFGTQLPERICNDSVEFFFRINQHTLTKLFLSGLPKSVEPTTAVSKIRGTTKKNLTTANCTLLTIDQNIDFRYFVIESVKFAILFVVLVGAAIAFIASKNYLSSNILTGKRNHVRQIGYLPLRITSALKVNMDNTHLFQNVTSCQLKINTKGNVLESSIDDNFLTLTTQASPNISELREAKLLRQSSLPHSCNDGAIMDDSLSTVRQKQTYCSVASLLPSLPCSPSKAISSVKKRLSNFEYCRSQSPRKSQQKQNGSFDENVTKYDSSSVMVSQINHMLNNVRMKDLCHNDDKENESPKAAEIINSPKMKITDHVLAEQNSPVHSDSSKGHFSFSPKQISTEDIPINSANWPLVNTINEPSSCYLNASPLLNSAVYKHGNYFKFPEVDSLSCEQPSDETLMIYNRTLIQKSSVESQASRRVRLKSISLDSDGARLVEDNLGIPVEELVQYANEIRPVSPKATVDKKQTENYVCSEKSKAQLGNKENTAASVGFLLPDSTIGSKTNCKNKNNLKINISKGSSTNSTNWTKSNECKLLLQVQTPKTPTLTQSRQKAFSLDSSDSNNMCSCPTVQSTRKPLMQHSTTNLRTVHQLSSISVPTTPKRQLNVSRKKSSGKPTTAMKPPNLKVPSSQLTPLNSVLKPLDYKHLSSGGIDDDQSLQIAIDIDDNNGDEIDDVNIDNIYIEEIDNDVIVLAGDVSKISYHDQIEVKKRNKSKLPESDGHFLGSSLHIQKCGTLSLSNNNLETLPEVMTSTDYGDCVCSDTVAIEEHNEKQKNQPIEDIRCGATKAGTFSRANILQRRGSNQSLTINLSMNGSLGNLTKCMSASNYSLGSFSGSNYNLNNCPQHQLQMCQQMQSNASSTQSIATHGYCNSQISMLHPYNASPLQQQNSFDVELTQPDSNLNRKNILQRRGSNTSLTLNLKGSSAASLSRFNSHSSLNISSVHSTTNSNSYGKFKPFTQYSNTHLQQPQLCNQYFQSQVFRQQQVNKKGLLERRNSNASLTLNIQNKALTSSSYNLRASICSLNNITNTSAESFENSTLPSNQNTKHEKRDTIDIVTSTDQRQRKFLSSENLNAMASQCNRLNQTHVRNSIKTCFGSVSDLKPSTGNSSDYQMNHVVDSDYLSNMGTSRQFGQSNLCSCTGVRNISTKPLSPQSTSEDFKLYLANIQLLQNATNVLTEDHLRKLHYIFEEIYVIRPQYRKNLTVYSEPRSYITAINQQAMPNSPLQKSNHFLFDALPSDDEKKLLRRSLHEEFWDLPTNHQEKPLVFGSQSKNRYKTILPNEHSRVILKAEYGTMQEPYIHANYIKGPDYARNSYIVTQGPLPNTIYDYWLMIHQNIEKYQHKPHQNEMEAKMRGCKLSAGGELVDIISKKNTYYPQKIVMLTNFIENNQQKCAVYFPVEMNQVIFITNSNERFESSVLASLYESYLNSSLETELSQESGLTLELDDGYFNCQQGCNSQQNVHDITKKNFFLIKNCGLREMEGYSIRQLTVLYVISLIKDNYRENQVSSQAPMTQVLKKFTCYHYWFPDWPDHHSPEDVGLLLDMSLHLLDIRYDSEFQIMRHEEKSNSKPIERINSVLEPILNMSGEIEPIPIIHCSAGIGRTGCLAAILNGIRQIRSSVLYSLRLYNNQLIEYSTYLRTPPKNFVNVDVLGIVCNLRLQRGGMVQNSEQYELIHRALCLYQSRIDAELCIRESKNIDPKIQSTIGSSEE